MMPHLLRGFLGGLTFVLGMSSPAPGRTPDMLTTSGTLSAPGVPSAPDTPSTAGALRKPNIIFILADDLGREALGCYGNEVNRTPNLDRLARQGMKFTEAHSTPLCTPSRVQVMTGKYNSRNYLSFGLLERSEKTFAHWLKEAGYATGIAGKWQLLGSRQQQERAGNRRGTLPAEAGFDQYCLWQVEKLGSRYKNPTITSSTSGTRTWTGRYGPDIFLEFALGFVREHRDRPFFFYYPMVLTHAPFQPTPDSPGYREMAARGVDDPKYFRDQEEYMDRIVGRLVEEVNALGLAENTLIVFTGDNGTGRPVTSTVEGRQIRGGKGSSTRYGTNVPLIASWPGTIPAGTGNDNLVDFTDFLPTFREAAGQVPSPGDGLDGLSLLGQLRGGASPVREWVFCYYNPQLYHDRKLIWAHDRRWKLYSDGRFFDTAGDPLEEHPLEEPALAPDARAAREKLRGVIERNLAAGTVARMQEEAAAQEGKPGHETERKPEQASGREE